MESKIVKNVEIVHKLVLILYAYLEYIQTKLSTIKERNISPLQANKNI